MNYHIIKGTHFSNLGLHFDPLLGKKKHVEFRFKFDSSCLYDLGNENNYDINKLFGISIGYHMNNSFRMGWRCVNGKLELHRFIHLNGKMQLENTFIQEIEVDQMYGGRFEREENKITLFLSNMDPDNEEVPYKFVQYFDSKCWFSYCLFPYFGGNEPAPHNMEVYLSHFVFK